MRDYCLICGNKEDPRNESDDESETQINKNESQIVPWMQCELCKRWVHFRCWYKFDAKNDFSYWENQNNKFKCFLH